MIVANEITEVKTDNIGQTARATIKASARLFQFFSDQIYADKYVAIWRELVANGMDAQVAAGNPEQQMIVTLPTDFTPYAKVRDFGTGMSHDFLMDKFMAYTDASTKENSNEFIGGFGIGSKAPLSYTEQFAIHSYQGGEVGIYSIFKDETGCPSIAFLARHPSPEPDGVEISFPVEGKDIKSFREAAYKTLNYFQPLPLLVNAEQQIFPPEYTVKTDTWGFLKGANDSRVIQGGIAYPIDRGQISEIDYLLDYGIDFYVPIGSCSIALSRERLSYDDRTVRVLKSFAEAIKPDLEKHVSAMFENLPNRWAAEDFYGVQTSTTYGHRQKLIAGLASYKGKKLYGRIKPNEWALKLNIGMVTSTRYSKSNYQMWSEGRTNPTVRAWMTDLHPKDISIILIDDGPSKPILRMRRYLEENDISARGVVIFRPKVDEEMSAIDWGRFLISLGRPPFKKLSEIEPAVVTRAAPTQRLQKVRAYQVSNLNYSVSRSSKYVDLDPSVGGYYVKMDNFHRMDGQATKEQLLASGLKPEEVYWFNKGDFEYVNNNPLWVPATQAYEEAMEKYKLQHRNLALAQAFQIVRTSEYAGHHYNYRAMFIDLLKLSGFNVPKQGPLYQLNKLFNLIKDQLNDRDRYMRGLLKVDCTKQSTLVRKILDDIYDKYPELALLVMSRNGNVSSSLTPVYNRLI